MHIPTPRNILSLVCAGAAVLLVSIAFAQTSEQGASGAAGLQELARAGAIRPPRREEVSVWIDGASRPYQSKLSPAFRFEVQFDYAVTRAVMLPDGLTGAASKKFLVLAGVVAPRGSAGHSCVAQMDGFRVNSDLACLSDDREAIAELRALPPPDAVQACRLIDPPAGAWLEAVSAYEPEGAEHWFGSKRMPVPIAVHVTRPGDIVLVLNTYEPATWRVSVGAESRIAAVLLSGNYTSSVEDLASGTPVVMSDYEGRELRPEPRAGCEPFHVHTGSAYRGGPHALLLDRHVHAVTGRTLDRFTGKYALKKVEISD
jgi:hypothetical protein